MVSEKLGAAFVEVGVDTGGLTTGLAGAKAQVTGFGASASSAFLGLVSSINPATIAIAGATAAVAALGAGIVSSVGAAADFQQSMANVASVTGGGAAELEALSNAARKAGASTVFSAMEAADAQYFLASAGMNTNEIIAAQGDVLLLAGAGGLEMGRSAEIVTGTLAQFNMEVEETGRVVNVMAAAAAGSNTTINQIGEGMKNAGAFANAAGVSFEMTSAALMVFADSNIKGAEGGTALKSMIASLLTPSKGAADALAEMGLSVEDVSLETHTLDEVLQTLNDHQMTAAQSSAIFGKEMAGAGTVLVGGAGDLQTYTAAITGTTKAQEMYNTQMGTFRNAMKMVESAVTEAKMSLGSVFLPALTTLAGGLALGVTAVTNFGKALGSAFASSSLAGSLKSFGSLISTELSSGFAAGKAMLAEFNSAFEAVFGSSLMELIIDGATKPLSMVVDALEAILSATAPIRAAIQSGVVQAVSEIATKIKEVSQFAKDFIGLFKDTDSFKSLQESWDKFKSAYESTLTAAKARWDETKTAIGNVVNEIQVRLQPAVQWVSDKFEALVGWIERIAGVDFSDLVPGIGKGLGDREGLVGDLWRSGSTALALATGRNDGEAYVDGMLSETDAIPEAVDGQLEEIDGEGAGEKVGKDFQTGFLAGTAKLGGMFTKQSMDSMHAAGMMYNYATGQYESRSGGGSDWQWGETFEAGGSTIGVGYEKGGQLPWFLQIGDWRKSFDSPYAARAYVAEHFLALDSLISPEQWEIAWKSARGSTVGKYDDPGDVVKLKAKLAGGKSAWDLFAEELAPTQAQIAEIQAAYESAFQEAMGRGAFVGDMKTAMEDLGKTGAKAFSDGWISGTEAAEMVAEYSRLKVFDPERYTELGGDGAVAFWEGAKEKLETLAALEAAGQLGTIEYKDALEDLSQHLNDPANTVYVRGKLDVGVSPEVSAFREALLWEDWGGSDAEIGLWKYRDDLVDLHYAVETATEYQGDLARAFDIVTNAGKHENQVVEEAINLLRLYTDIPLSSIRGIADYYKSITDEVGKSKKEIKNWGEQVDASLACACGAMSDFAKWQEDPKNQMFQPSGIMNSKKYFEEILANPDQYRPGQVEYAVELYAQWKIDEDAKTRLIEESGFSADEPLEISVVPVLSDSAFETAVEMPIIPTIGDGAESEIEATVNLKGREAAEAIRAAGTAFVASGRQAGDYLVTTSTTLRGQISDAGTAFREQGFAVSSKFRSDVYSAGSNFFSRVDAAAARLEDALAGVGGGGGGGFFGSSSSGGGLWSGGYSGGTIAPRSGWMDAGGIVYSPTIVGVGEKRPEAIAPLADLLPMIQQAVASAGGSSGPIHIGEINVYSSGDAEEVARAVVEELRVEISNAYVNRRRG